MSSSSIHPRGGQGASSGVEGVTQFKASHSTRALNPQECTPLAPLLKWREIFIRLEMVGGENPDRYQGLGFGNLSGRLSTQGFLITGSQTGHLPSMSREDFAVVTQCYPQSNHVVSHGIRAPSSEAMTHGILYKLDPEIFWVFHVHSPEIWLKRHLLKLPCTSPEVGYGTPEMALEVASLLGASSTCSQRIIAMGGHEDGLLCFSADADRCGQALLDLHQHTREICE